LVMSFIIPIAQFMHICRVTHRLRWKICYRFISNSLMRNVRPFRLFARRSVTLAFFSGRLLPLKFFVLQDELKLASCLKRETSETFARNVEASWSLAPRTGFEKLQFGASCEKLIVSNAWVSWFYRNRQDNLILAGFLLLFLTLLYMGRAHFFINRVLFLVSHYHRGQLFMM
jgi:hypothetical protein